jgi:O-antigen/teichoic acid export membrane protein
METSAAASRAEKPGSDGHLVLRNTAYLSIAELVCVPASVLVNAVLGRYLGPIDLGSIYLASTIAAVAILIVGWGHSGTLPAAIAVDRHSAGTLLGSSIGWRVVASVFAYALLALGGKAFGFTSTQQWALGLVFLCHAILSIVAACQDAIRGFERTDIAAVSRVGSQLISTVLVIPVLLAGGRLRLALLAQAMAAGLVLLGVLRALKPIGITRVAFDRNAWRQLMKSGTPFVFFQLALVLQPNVGAFYLAKLASREALGWYSVAARLVGFLLVPASALIGALYPTLCRLRVSDQEGFLSTSRAAITSVSIVVAPVALGCALYPDIGVSIFGRAAFRPSEDILRVFSIQLLLIYFTMPLGTILLASGNQRRWSLVQLGCVMVSAILSPLLIPRFQASHGNGAIGLAIADSTAELLVVASGIVMVPKGVLDRGLGKTLALTGLAGAAMAGAALALRSLPSLLAAPLAVLAYGSVLFATGVIHRGHIASLRGFLRRDRAPRNPAAD